MLETTNLCHGVFIVYIEQIKKKKKMTKICANQKSHNKGHYFRILIFSFKMINSQ